MENARRNKQLLMCTRCGQVLYREFHSLDGAALGPLANHPHPIHAGGHCLGSGSIGKSMGVGRPPERAIPG
jgi:hypothetical protein